MTGPFGPTCPFVLPSEGPRPAVPGRLYGGAFVCDGADARLGALALGVLLPSEAPSNAPSDAAPPSQDGARSRAGVGRLYVLERRAALAFRTDGALIGAPSWPDLVRALFRENLIDEAEQGTAQGAAQPAQHVNIASLRLSVAVGRSEAERLNTLIREGAPITALRWRSAAGVERTLCHAVVRRWNPVGAVRRCLDLLDSDPAAAWTLQPDGGGRIRLPTETVARLRLMALLLAEGVVPTDAELAPLDGISDLIARVRSRLIAAVNQAPGAVARGRVVLALAAFDNAAVVPELVRVALERCALERAVDSTTSPSAHRTAGARPVKRM